MKTYADVRREVAAPTSNDPADERLPCGFCKAPTERKTLSLYGSRCGKCFAAYMGEAPSSPTRVRNVSAALSAVRRIA